MSSTAEVLSRDNEPGTSEAAIPTIDLGPVFANEPGALESTAAQLRKASTEIGFYLIKNHGVGQWIIDRMHEEAIRFHALPIEEKMAIKINADNIGYLPMKGNIGRHSKIRDNKRPNLNESFIIKRDRGPDNLDVLANKPFRGLNKWPDSVPGFRETLVAYIGMIELLGKRMLPIYSVALGMPRHFFNDHDAFRNEPQLSCRVAHYPPQPGFDGEEFGSAPHTDGGFMTILPHANVSGLEVMHRDGTWIKVPLEPRTFIVNTGDMLTRWSNDLFISTPHRVINYANQDRYSFPVFFDPNTEAVMECLPTCTGPGNPAKYPPITYQQYYGEFISRNYTHLQQGQQAG